jgi:hypothetical protein
MHDYWMAVWTVLKARWELVRREPEAGYSAETVLVTALTIIAIIVAKVTAKATGITL